jgi:hypothetical protein
VKRAAAFALYVGWFAFAIPVVGVLAVADVVSDAVEPMLERRAVRRRLRGRR